MAAARITAEASGRLQVPDEPLLPVIEGDGPGPEIWRATRAVLDAAVERVSEGRRRLHFLPVLAGERAKKEHNDPAPDSTINAFRLHRVGLCGPLAARAPVEAELAEILDLFLSVELLRTPPGAAGPPRDLLLVSEAREDSADAPEFGAGGSQVFRVLHFLEQEAPTELARVRFGTAEGVNELAELRGLAPTGIVEAALSLRAMSRLGTERLVRGALRLASERGLDRVTLLHDEGRFPATEGSFRAWAREAAQEDPAAAPGAPRAKVEELSAPLALERLVREPGGRRLVAGPHLHASALAAALRPGAGGPALAALARMNLDTGHAVFSTPLRHDPDAKGPGTAGPAAMIRAGEQLLHHLGWTDVAKLVRHALDATLAAGVATPDVAAALRAAGAPAPREVGCAEFGREVLARVRA